jgi:hypothetical protein
MGNIPSIEERVFQFVTEQETLDRQAVCRKLSRYSLEQLTQAYWDENTFGSAASIKATLRDLCIINGAGSAYAVSASDGMGDTPLRASRLTLEMRLEKAKAALRASTGPDVNLPADPAANPLMVELEQVIREQLNKVTPMMPFEPEEIADLFGVTELQLVESLQADVRAIEEKLQALRAKSSKLGSAPASGGLQEG